MTTTSFPDAVPHTEIKEIFPDSIYMVTGEISLRLPLGLRCRFSRNMTILKQKDNELVLVNTVRLSEVGLKELDKLGTVTHILKIAGYHGKDDPFYKDRYKNAKVWALEGSGYNRGFSYDPENMYFTPDAWITEGSSLPLKDEHQFVVIHGKKPPSESAIFLPKQSVLILGDSLQNFDKNDPFIDFFSSWVMFAMGFFTPFNVGPAWSKSIQVSQQTMADKLLTLQFENAIPAHGTVVKGEAWKKFEPSIRLLPNETNWKTE